MLSIKTYTDRDARDRAYYELAKTHCDVMRYGDQVAGDPILNDEFEIVKYAPGHMVFCVAYGPARKPKLAEDVAVADRGIDQDAGVPDGFIDPNTGEVSQNNTRVIEE